MHNALPTMENLKGRNVKSPYSCPLCLDPNENIIHVLKTYHYIEHVVSQWEEHQMTITTYYEL